MMIHSKRHNNVKSFVCDTCDKRFRLAFDLAIHMRCHSDIFAYTCKFCPRKFKHHSGLRVKCMRVWCIFLNISFDSILNLKTHQRTHTADKPYSCPVCEYRSTNRSNLKKHSMRIHCEYDEWSGSKYNVLQISTNIQMQWFSEFTTFNQLTESLFSDWLGSKNETRSTNTTIEETETLSIIENCDLKKIRFQGFQVLMEWFFWLNNFIQ